MSAPQDSHADATALATEPTPKAAPVTELTLTAPENETATPILPLAEAPAPMVAAAKETAPIVTTPSVTTPAVTTPTVTSPTVTTPTTPTASPSTSKQHPPHPIRRRSTGTSFSSMGEGIRQTIQSLRKLFHGGGTIHIHWEKIRVPEQLHAQHIATSPASIPSATSYSPTSIKRFKCLQTEEGFGRIGVMKFWHIGKVHGAYTEIAEREELGRLWTCKK
ncbi:hypothetical protein PHLCEN_2v4206 [Hermanssonia centrifuga]|uniref:Uncharacterized protein n=1 Tax=Hermanssonia centrifuga TaxID=98765 RepID=A0A2R6PZ05_9APHY|nr:hypothetical protein PHLCEN_2v4206 [Hermanssonia centrifuga]